MPSDTISNYVFQERLGAGSFGIVYRATRISDGKTVAIKKCRNNCEEEFVREFRYIKKFTHLNIIKFEQVFSSKTMYIVLEYMDYDLRKYLELIDTPLEDDLIESYTIQLLNGLDYLHSNGYIHRDLKPQNVLIDKNGFLKICDFGSCCKSFTPVHRTRRVGTLWYYPPDLFLGREEYSFEVDVWAFGCIYYELHTREYLFTGSCKSEILKMICERIGPLTDCNFPKYRKYQKEVANNQLEKESWQEIPSSCRFFLDKSLTWDPDQRATVKDLLNGPFSAKINEVYQFFRNIQKSTDDTTHQ